MSFLVYLRQLRDPTVYCNHGNYDTALFLSGLGANVTVITVITGPYYNYDTCELPDPDERSRLGLASCLT